MDKQLFSTKDMEKLLSQAIGKVGREQDKALLEAMKGMTHEELDAALTATPQPTILKKRLHRMTILRFAAACAVLLLVLVGVDQLHLGGNIEQGNASLFNTYYKEYRATSSTFDAANDQLNAFGQRSTAAIIGQASVLINQKHSRHSLHRGIYMLEHLLTLNYKPSLAHEIHWYLALGYLKDNRRDKAVAEFRTVIELEQAQHINTHISEAKAMLKELNQ